MAIRRLRGFSRKADHGTRMQEVACTIHKVGRHTVVELHYSFKADHSVVEVTCLAKGGDVATALVNAKYDASFVFNDDRAMELVHGAAAEAFAQATRC